jgi:two-component system cell cycle response regulator
MRNKILTVDDSKTVRIIVKKAFKPFDIELFEASNGVEGLAIAAKDLPDLILLDVTMPVMDGVEMLTKIKADPQLKGIPVMMLTAEGGRENVLKIAKIGVRDYLVKPFKEESLLEKAGRIIDLKPLAEGPVKVRSILDPVDILVVEDKPVIIQQIQDGLKHTPWKIHGVTSQSEAIDFCARKEPDLIMISLSLPDDSAFTLFRSIRTNVKTKFKPVFALVVKTEMNSQNQAQQVGFSSIITKPIDISELEGKMAKAMNLDTSMRYYRIEGDYLIMNLPENSSPAVLAEAAHYLKPKLAEAVDAGLKKAVIDIHLVRSLHMGVIKILMQAMQTCRELAMQYTLIGNSRLIAECKGFEDTRSWVFFETLEEAKSHLASLNPPAAAAAGPAAAASPAAAAPQQLVHA